MLSNTASQGAAGLGTGAAPSLAAEVVASLPSPSSTGLDLGPLTLNYYGLCIGLGVVAAVMLARRRSGQVVSGLVEQV